MARHGKRVYSSAAANVLTVKYMFCQTNFNYNDYQLTECKPRLCQDEYYRSSTCKVLIKPDKNSCAHCHPSSQKFVSEKNRKVNVLKQPAKLNAPIKFISPERIK